MCVCVYLRRVFKWITQCDSQKIALINSLVFAALFNAPKKHVLKQAVICAALGRLRWSLWKWDVASVFFNVHLVCKSPTEFSTPICAFMELHFNDNLPCLVNLALYVKWSISIQMSQKLFGFITFSKMEPVVNKKWLLIPKPTADIVTVKVMCVWGVSVMRVVQL